MQHETNSIPFTQNNFGKLFFFDTFLTKMESNFYKLSFEVFGACSELILSVILFKNILFDSRNQKIH
jgi:hypothetical protein